MINKRAVFSLPQTKKKKSPKSADEKIIIFRHFEPGTE